MPNNGQTDPDRSHLALFAHLREIQLSERALHAARSLGISWVGQLVECTEAELLRTPGTGRKTVAEISTALRSYGLQLGMDLPDWSDLQAKQVREQLKGTFRRRLSELNRALPIPSATLDEELARPVAMTQSPRNVGLLLSLWGFDGSARKTLEAVGTSYSMSRERVRQIEARAIGDLQTAWHAMPLLDKAIGILEGDSPTLSSDLAPVLNGQGIETVSISGKSLLCAARIFERKTELTLGGRADNPIIGFNDDLQFVSQALRELKRATQAAGCTNLSRVTLILGKSLNETGKLQKILPSFPEVV